MPENLILIFLVFPVLKLFHEFGHAYATKAFGGEVHEMGVMMIVFTPIPYVDATSANSFREKWKRVGVSAAGLVVELFLASLALFIWLGAEPGAVRSVAFNVMLIAGVSTVLFNANPLIRFDGYYILSDWIEIPNLRGRAGQYLAYLWERYVYGQKTARPPNATSGERAWFVPYAVASFFYRFVIMFGIIMLIADKMLALGLILGALTFFTMVIKPLAKGGSFVIKSPRLKGAWLRAIATSVLCAALVVWLLFFLPFPLRTRAEGVLWLPEESIVRAGTEGTLDRIQTRSGEYVRGGDRALHLYGSGDGQGAAGAGGAEKGIGGALHPADREGQEERRDHEGRAGIRERPTA